MVFKKLFVSAALIGLFTASLGLAQGEPAPGGAPEATPPAAAPAPATEMPKENEKGMHDKHHKHMKHHDEKMVMCCTKKNKNQCKDTDYKEMEAHKCHKKKGHMKE